MLQLLEDQIKCAICLDDYDGPISLYCGHTFCRDCLKKAENMVCPICRSIIFSSIDNLRINQTICKLIRQVNNQRSKLKGIILFEHQNQRPLFQQFFDVQKIRLKSLPVFYTTSKKLLIPFMTFRITLKSLIWDLPKELKNVVIKQSIQYITRSYRPYYIYGHLSNIERKPDSLSEFDCSFEALSFFEIDQEDTTQINERQMPVCSGSSFNEKTGLGVEHFEPFFKIYDKLAEQYKDSIRNVIGFDSFGQRQNSIVVLYSIFSLLNIGNAQKYSVLTTFDDQIRLQRLRSYFTNISTDHAIRNPNAVMNIPVPGYSKTRTVFLAIAVLFVLWKMGWIPNLYGSFGATI